jgi:hypothetical protein
MAFNQQEGQRRAMLEKAREASEARTEEQKQALRDETSGYRLQAAEDKFASTSNAVDVALSAATVGFLSKEEYGKRKAAVEAEAKRVAEAAAAPPAEEKKRKKKKPKQGALSFAFDDDDGDGGDEDLGAAAKKPKQDGPSEADPTEGAADRAADAAPVPDEEASSSR